MYMRRWIDSNLKCTSGEFNADSRLGLQTKLVASESGEEVGLADARVSDQNNLEQVIVFLVRSSRHLSLRSLWLVCYSIFFSFPIREKKRKEKENLRSPKKWFGIERVPSRQRGVGGSPDERFLILRNCPSDLSDI